MSRPEDIPEWAWDAAHAVLNRNARNPIRTEQIARALIAAKAEERERCAKVAEGDSNTFDFDKAWDEMRDSEAGFASARLQIAASIRKGDA